MNGDLIQIYNFLSDTEIEYLNNICKNFVGDFVQIYNRRLITSTELLDFKIKTFDYVKSTFGDRYEPIQMWINEIKETDGGIYKLHQDTSDLTIITYFHTDFEGGEFEYVNIYDKNIIIQPEINLSLIMNNDLWHRVMPVKKGTRYSLVSFFKVVSKNDKKQSTLF